MKTLKYFSAPWCGPCKLFKPIVNELVEEGYSVEFIDIDEQLATAIEHEIRSIPTIIIEEAGVEITRVVGRASKVRLLEKLEQ